MDIQPHGTGQVNTVGIVFCWETSNWRASNRVLRMVTAVPVRAVATSCNVRCADSLGYWNQISEQNITEHWALHCPWDCSSQHDPSYPRMLGNTDIFLPVMSGTIQSYLLSFSFFAFLFCVLCINFYLRSLLRRSVRSFKVKRISDTITLSKARL
jgi:hypothetical protein